MNGISRRKLLTAIPRSVRSSARTICRTRSFWLRPRFRMQPFWPCSRKATDRPHRSASPPCCGLVADSHANGEPEFAGEDGEGGRQTWAQAVKRMCAEVLERMTLARS